MTTKYRIAEQILFHLNKRSTDTDISMQELMLRVAQGLAYLARTRYFISKQYDVEDIDGGLVYTFKNITVSYDNDMDEFYCELPSTTMSFPYGLGIKQISPMKNSKHFYVPVSNGFLGLYSGLSSSNLENGIGYYIDGYRVSFVNMSGINNPAEVLIKQILPLDGIDDDTPINIPMDMQDEVIKYVVSLYAPMPQKDTTNDNVDQA
jgi:hypothetical protein